MVYRMDFYVDGGCRRNGKPGAIAAFAAVRKYRWGKHRHWKERHPVSPTPTSSRAELLAIILALKKAFERYEKLHEPKPKLKVKIYSDSKYGTGCINEWVHKWVADGWKNSRGTEVANLDLVQELYELHQRLKKLGSVKYTWIPRAENNDADGYCNKVLDAMEIEQKRYVMR